MKIERRSSKRLLKEVNDVLGDLTETYGEFVKTATIRQVVVDLILPFKMQYDALSVEVELVTCRTKGFQNLADDS